MNRREVLTGMALASAAVAVPATVVAKSLPASRVAWDRAMAHMRRCEEAFKRSEQGYDAFEQAYERARPSVDMIDFHEFRPAPDRDHVARVLDIDKYEEQRLSSEGKLWWAENPEACRAKIRAACDSVREFRRLERDAAQRTGFHAYSEKHEAISERHSEALDALVEMPAPDAEALLWKITYLFTASDTCWSEDFTAQFFTDANRLLLKGTA